MGIVLALVLPVHSSQDFRCGAVLQLHHCDVIIVLGLIGAVLRRDSSRHFRFSLEHYSFAWLPFKRTCVLPAVE